VSIELAMDSVWGEATIAEHVQSPGEGPKLFSQLKWIPEQLRSETW